MGHKGESATLALIGFLLCFSSLMSTWAYAQRVVDDDIASIKVLLSNKQFDRAEKSAMLLLERALQQQSYPADAFLCLGKTLKKASRFAVAKSMLTATLVQYTAQANLEKMSLTLLSLAGVERHLANYTTAMAYAQRAMSLAHLERNEALKAKLNLEIGIIHQMQGNVESALSPFKDALRFFRVTRDPQQTSATLVHIADTYRLLNETALSRTYYEDALTLLNTEDSNNVLIGTIKTRIGNAQKKEGFYENAIATISEGLNLHLAADNKKGVAEAQIALGEAFIAMGNSSRGFALIQEAMAFAQSSTHAVLIKQARLALAQALIDENDFKQALVYAREGTLDAREEKDIRSQLTFLSLQLSAYVSLNEFKKALDIQAVIQQLRELLLNSQNKSAIEGLQAEIELVRQSTAFEKLKESKQLALAQAERENLSTTLFWSLTLAGILSLFLVWSRYRQRQETILLAREVKQQTLALQQKNDELKQAYSVLEEVSLRDRLTGLYNRHYLESHLPGELRRSQFATKQNGNNKTSNSDLLCLLIDIDFFKRINDDYGHIAGDEVLAGFAKILKDAFRQTDLIVRWGGEEFLVVCRQSNREDLPKLAERCREMVASTPFDIGLTSPIYITCSIGFSLLPPNHMEDFEMLWGQTFEVIDYALYATKLSGRNGWVGVIEIHDETSVSQTPLDAKFKFPGSRIATSFNNVASIKWPEIHEE